MIGLFFLNIIISSNEVGYIYYCRDDFQVREVIVVEFFFNCINIVLKIWIIFSYLNGVIYSLLFVDRRSYLYGCGFILVMF